MPSRFGKYELVRSLGRGGMAEAWLASQRGAAGVTKRVVIKKVLPEASEASDLIEAFIEEAKISASLSHGNIAQVFEFGEVDGEYYLAMEWVDGRSLAQVLRRATSKGYWHLPVAIAAYIAIEALKGLHHAHTRRGPDGKLVSLVHRDVTPDNILLSFEGEVKVADFGIAKASLAGRKETQAGVVKGKFLFFSPEQALGAPVDARTDIYAVGVSLYQMLTGHLPFSGSYLTVMPRLVAGAFTGVRVLNPEIPAALEDIVHRAMAKEPDARYHSALEMLEALTAFLSENAPTFSGQRLQLLLEYLYADELAAEGARPSFSENSRELLTAWLPSRPRTSTGESAPDRTIAELDPVGERPNVGRLRTVLVAALVVFALGGAGVAAVYFGSAASNTVNDDSAALTPLPPPRATPLQAPSPVLDPPQPNLGAIAPPVASSPVPESRAQRIKLNADAHVVKKRASKNAKDLSASAVWRATLVQPGPLVSNVVLEAESAKGTTLIPLKDQQTQELRGKKRISATCEPGAKADPSQTAMIVLTSSGAPQAERLLIDPKHCIDFEQAKGLELMSERFYRLSVVGGADLSLGPGVPIRVFWRGRSNDGSFLSGSLKPNDTAVVHDVVFLELGLLDSDTADNTGALEVAIDEIAPPVASPSVEPTRPPWPRGAVPLSYSESLAIPAVQRARSLIRQGRYPEVLPALAGCFKEPRPVPECYRLEGQAYVRLEQRERAMNSYRHFMEIASDDHPGRYAVQAFLDSAPPP